MGKNWKAILAFVALVVTNVAALVNGTGGAVVPQTVAQWVWALGTTFVGTYVVWAKSNNTV